MQNYNIITTDSCIQTSSQLLLSSSSSILRGMVSNFSHASLVRVKAAFFRTKHAPFGSFTYVILRFERLAFGDQVLEFFVINPSVPFSVDFIIFRSREQDATRVTVFASELVRGSTFFFLLYICQSTNFLGEFHHVLVIRNVLHRQRARALIARAAIRYAFNLYEIRFAEFHQFRVFFGFG